LVPEVVLDAELVVPRKRDAARGHPLLAYGLIPG
jgi:hypothetical protein